MGDCGKRVYDDTPSLRPAVSTSLESIQLERDVRPHSSSVPKVLPTRPPATRVWPTRRRSTCATTPTTCPTATSRRSPWWGSSVQPHTSCRQTLWQEDFCLSQDSLNLVMKLPT